MINFIPTDTCYWIACPISEIENYERIYKIKKRSYNKPLAVMVQDFNWLESNSTLTHEQVTFLKNYDKPFTVLTDCSAISHWINFEEEDICFRNRETYTRIAIRVANLDIQKKLIKRVGPIFLTSANITDKPEIYNIKGLKEDFSYYLDNNKVEILGSAELDPNTTSSEIFSFVWDTLEQEFIRN